MGQIISKSVKKIVKEALASVDSISAVSYTHHRAHET